MTPEERVLEAIGEKAIRPPALWAALRNEMPSAIEAALRKLQRTGEITFELGHYQRGKIKSKAPPAVPTITNRPPVMNPPADKAEAGNRAKRAPRQGDPDHPGRGVSGLTSGSEARPVTPTEQSPMPAKTQPVVVSTAASRNSMFDVLTNRQREIFNFLEAGLSHRGIADRLGISIWTVRDQLKTARERLGMKGRVGRPPRREKPTQLAPSAAEVQKAAPSTPEGAPAATGGAKVIPWLLARDQQAPEPAPRRPTFSRDLISRLVAQQRAKAEYVQILCKELSGARQELADIEELVRIATAKETA